MKNAEGTFDHVGLEKDYEVDEVSHNDAYTLAINADLNDSIEQDNEVDWSEYPIGAKNSPWTYPHRPKLSNKTMIKGLVQRTENYNKNFDRKAMTDSRIAHDVEQMKRMKMPDVVVQEIERMVVSNQHIHVRGRGDSFGRLRSSSHENDKPVINKPAIFSPTNDTKIIPFANRINDILSNNSSGNTSRIIVSEEDNRSLSFQSPRRSSLASRLAKESADPPVKHQFDPSTAYNGKVAPDYRYSYNPQPPPCPHVLPALQAAAPYSPATLVRPGQRYPKRPENNPQLPPKPKPLNHDYYEINLYGDTQEERIAQRIEKTVRQTEAPVRF